MALLNNLSLLPIRVLFAAAAVVFLLFATLEQDPRKSSKKPLVLTSRAAKLLIVATAGAVLWAVSSSAVIGSSWIWIVSIQIIPFLLVVANYALSPFQAQIEKRFWEEAHNKLLSIKPKTVGITGSFGKTSVKHIITHILETRASTLMTPGSVNTAMGIARVIREQLRTDHKFFVCEMGAYGVGSISKLTALAPPDVGVITSIGQAHFERFKTLDTVAQAKFELADSVIKRAGKVIVGESALEQPSARSFAANHRANLLIVGYGEDCDVRIVSVTQNVEGIETDVTWKDSSYKLHAPLFGQHQALNIALSFAAACELGVTAEDAIIALISVAQIKHRLEVKRNPSGWVKIDDAYNSNPVGFASALSILDLFRRDGGRRILITPGMVELGDAHDLEHEKLGRVAGSYVDVLVAIMPERIPTFVSAFRARNPDGVIRSFTTYTEANEWLTSNVSALDVVLVENDLPDVYEKRLKL
jgi:UDP-N-acetylmuramoyl-tripeptide--D-alanyl-D-alanine ligase